MKPPFVEIVWNDPWSDAVTAVTLRDVQDTHKPEVITTRGWLLYENEEGVSIACEECADGSYRGRSYILKVLIKSTAVLHISKPRKKKGAPDAPTAPAPAPAGNSSL